MWPEQEREVLLKATAGVRRITCGGNGAGAKLIFHYGYVIQPIRRT